jgi:pentatricopeptide repeat protein
MVQAGVQPDTAIYNSIMRQQASAGMGPDVLESTLSDMEAHGLTPDRHSLFLLLRAYGRMGDLGGAMSVMRHMAQLGRGPP